MADHTGIEWADATWNPIVGCSIVSPGCTNCYAMGMAARIEAMQPGSHYAGTTQPSKAGAVWSGRLELAPDHILTQPLGWRRPRRIFVNSMGDLFHESVWDGWIDRVFAVMALAPQHTFMVLTKRSSRMRQYLAEDRRRWRCASVDWLFPQRTDASRQARDRLARLTAPGLPAPLENVWLGVSTERQAEWDARVADLKATPAAVRFVSAEPLLGPIVGDFSLINLAIVGGESGPKARPMHPDWARSLRDQCAAAGTAFFFKQWGEWLPLGQSGFTGWSAANRSAAAQRRKWLGHAHFNDGARGPETHKSGPLRTDYVLSPGRHAGELCVAIGKRAAGRRLDGVEHNAMPETRA